MLKATKKIVLLGIMTLLTSCATQRPVIYTYPPVNLQMQQDNQQDSDIWDAYPKNGETGISSGEKADYVLVEKSKRLLILYHDHHIIKRFHVALGQHPVGKKMMSGDMRTPEGRYRIDYRNPNSEFYLSLHISYPNKEDRENAARLGVSPGGDIMIHGIGKIPQFVASAHAARDWTAGCIALTNAEIRQIWNLVPVGTTIDIVP